MDEIHITGSDRTHDAIVFGTGEEGARRKAERRPLLAKKITSELGNVTPVIVVPGKWSDADLAFHAANVATQLVYNSGFNCVTTRVIVTWAGWPQREAFLGALRKVLAAVPPRNAYYPGAEERYAAFLAKHPEGEQFGGRGVRPAPVDFHPEPRSGQRRGHLLHHRGVLRAHGGDPDRRDHRRGVRGPGGGFRQREGLGDAGGGPDRAPRLAA